MPRVNYIEPDGTLKTIEAHDGRSVMETALKNGVRGIVAECGGACACATCHVYVDEADGERVGEPGVVEDEMLEGVATDRLHNSRLSCQIKMRAELDGITVRIAEEQV